MHYRKVMYGLSVLIIFVTVTSGCSLSNDQW